MCAAFGVSLWWSAHFWFCCCEVNREAEYFCLNVCMSFQFQFNLNQKHPCFLLSESCQCWPPWSAFHFVLLPSCISGCILYQSTLWCRSASFQHILIRLQVCSSFSFCLTVLHYIQYFTQNRLPILQGFHITKTPNIWCLSNWKVKVNMTPIHLWLF